MRLVILILLTLLTTPFAFRSKMTAFVLNGMPINDETSIGTSMTVSDSSMTIATVSSVRSPPSLIRFFFIMIYWNIREAANIPLKMSSHKKIMCLTPFPCAEWAEFRDGIGKYLGNFEVLCNTKKI